MPWVNSNVVDIVPTVYAGYKEIIEYWLCVAIGTTVVIWDIYHRSPLNKVSFWPCESIRDLYNICFLLIIANWTCYS